MGHIAKLTALLARALAGEHDLVGCPTSESRAHKHTSARAGRGRWPLRTQGDCVQAREICVCEGWDRRGLPQGDCVQAREMSYAYPCPSASAWTGRTSGGKGRDGRASLELRTESRCPERLRTQGDCVQAREICGAQRGCVGVWAEARAVVAAEGVREERGDRERCGRLDGVRGSFARRV